GRLRQGPGLLQLRLPRVTRDQLRLPRLRQRVAEAPLPGRVHRRAAARPADGLLLAGQPDRRCAQARRAGARRGRERERDPRHPAGGQPPGGGGGGAGPGGPGAGTRGPGPPPPGGPGRPPPGGGVSARRTALPARALEALATAGAFGCFGVPRREALWAAGAAATIRAGQLPGTAVGLDAPPLPAMTAAQETFADLWATRTYGTHPLAHVRQRLTDDGGIPAAALRTARPGAAVVVAGLVTHRQQPGTARGVVFLSLEDETGMANVICLPAVWERHRRMAVEASALLVYGRVERLDGSVS